MPSYRVYGTTRSTPKGDDWTPILETDDPVAATRAAHETEGTFWRRLTEDGQIVLDHI